MTAPHDASSDELADDLVRFTTAGPSPFHAVAELARRLEAAEFSALDERHNWSLAPGDTHYVVRDGGSIAAFRVGAAAPAEAGYRLVGAHTDSPTFRVTPRPEVRRSGYRLVGVEPYGSPLLHSWFDRDLTLAGRVAVAGDAPGTTRLVTLPGAPLRIPSLAIHLDRAIREEGFQPNPQQHVVPVWSHRDEAAGVLRQVAAAAEVAVDDLLGWDLVAADVHPPARGGADDEWVLSPRLDNLASCHAGAHALIGSGPAAATQVLVANDHEEVGSRSAEGAAGPFLDDVLARISQATGADDAQAHRRALAGSWLVSADMAHALHPGYPERHEPGHQPRLGGGPVLKVNANQAYASDATSIAWFTACCAEAGVPLQHFTSRSDLPCGSTIGPLTATKLGLRTVDVGNPLLSMHSVREQAAAADVAPMIAALRTHLERAPA